MALVFFVNNYTYYYTKKTWQEMKTFIYHASFVSLYNNSFTYPQ